MKIAVIGGGIAGLAAAHYAQVERAEVTVFEATNRVGGVISTLDLDGFRMEGGPDSILREKPAARELAWDLDLESEIVETRPEHRGTFIVRGGQLHPIPEGLRLMAPQYVRPFLRSRVVSWPGKFRMGLDLVRPGRRTEADESLADFVRRRFGRECLERLAQPMVAGIYCADPEQLSMQSTLPQFVEFERKYGSVLRGLWRNRSASAHGARYSLFFNFKGGTQTLIDALARKVPVRLGARVESLEPGWHVNGEKFDAVVLALPAGPAAGLLRHVAPLLARELEGIPYLGSVTVNMTYPGDVLGRRSGYGFVVPAVERMALLACTFSHLKWPGRAERGSLLRAYLGGAFDPDAVSRSDDELLLRVRRDFERLLGIREAPTSVFVHRHPASMPVYTVGHKQRVQRLDAALPGLPGLGLAGNALTGVGIPDVIARARGEVRRLLGV